MGTSHFSEKTFNRCVFALLVVDAILLCLSVITVVDPMFGVDKVGYVNILENNF